MHSQRLLNLRGKFFLVSHTVLQGNPALESVKSVAPLSGMKHTIKTFGIARDIMGGRQVVLETTAGTVGDLRKELLHRYPQLIDLHSLLIAVNMNYADDGVPLTETDEIALIPPVSGG